MAKRRSGLGRGLDALIPGTETGQTEKGRIVSVSVDSIEPNPSQPRKNFDIESLQELASSIREHGILQPLIVTGQAESESYTLIAGERRLMAAKIAGLTKVPAILRGVSDQERLELALIENLQREDLNPLEAAIAYHQLIEEFGLTHGGIASKVGKSRTSITNTLRLLNLAEVVQNALLDTKITEGHARAILGLPTEAAQENALKIILDKDLTVRQTEDLVRSLLGDKPEKPKSVKKVQRLQHLEERLRSSLGTKVRVNHGKKGGAIVIHYYSDEELDTLLDILAPTEQ